MKKNIIKEKSKNLKKNTLEEKTNWINQRVGVEENSKIIEHAGYRLRVPIFGFFIDLLIVD